MIVTFILLQVTLSFIMLRNELQDRSIHLVRFRRTEEVLSSLDDLQPSIL